MKFYYQCGHIKFIEIINHNEGLTAPYNRGLAQATNDIVVFMHDDLIINTKNMNDKVLKLTQRHSDYGIIGIAGTDKMTSGRWWDNRENMFGVVGHVHEGKRHVNHYSKGVYNDVLKDVVIVDGLFFTISNSDFSFVISSLILVICWLSILSLCVHIFSCLHFECLSESFLLQ